MSHQVKIIALLTAKEGRAEELCALLHAMIAPSRSEAGTLRYDLWREPDEPSRFVLDELYVDAAAVAAHRATPHFQLYLSKINDLADRTAMLLDPIAVA